MVDWLVKIEVKLVVKPRVVVVGCVVEMELVIMVVVRVLDVASVVKVVTEIVVVGCVAEAGAGVMVEFDTSFNDCEIKAAIETVVAIGLEVVAVIVVIAVVETTMVDVVVKMAVVDWVAIVIWLVEEAKTLKMWSYYYLCDNTDLIKNIKT